MDDFSEARLKEVHPLLAEKIKKMAEMLEPEGIVFRVTQGLRTWNQQQALYDQGRKTPGKIVTNAPPGHSWHNFGLAVDVVPMDQDVNPPKPDWNINHPAWKRLISVGESLGLMSGSEFRSFPDWPHFQLTGKWPVSPDDEVRQVFKDGGMQAIWDDSQVVNA